MQDIHEHDTEHEADKSGIESEAQIGGECRDVALDRLLSERERVADAAHCADEADSWDGPRDVADERKRGVELIRRDLGAFFNRVGRVLD